MSAHDGSDRNGNGRRACGSQATELALAELEPDGIPSVSPNGARGTQAIEGLTATLLQAIGEDPRRPGLEKTPRRVAKAWEFLTSGYRLTPADVLGDAIFPAEGSQLVVVREVEFFSLCEHHLLPFYGRAHVGYLPDRSILGLSKIARLVEVFARRLQVQERLTAQVAHALAEALGPRGVGVVTEAEHLCMTMRGVQKPGSITTTSCMLGAFDSDPALRGELLDALARGR